MFLQEAGIKLTDFQKGNEKARERMKVQFSIASPRKALLVRIILRKILPAFTKYGDGAADIAPISV